MDLSVSTLNHRQMKALQWLAGQEEHHWVALSDKGPRRLTLEALVRRGLAVRSSGNGDLYRLTVRGRVVSPTP